MKRITFLMATCFLSLTLVACGNNKDENGATDPSTTEGTKSEETTEVNHDQDGTDAKAEVEEYLDEVRPVALDLTALGERWDEVRNYSANGEIDDIEFGNILYDEMIPLNMDLQERAENINTPNDRIADMNEIFIDMIGDQQLAFTEILSAIETGDSSKITSANALLNDVRKKEREYMRELEKLVEEYDVDMK